MTSQTFIVLSSLLTFGVPAALALRELLTLSATSHGRDEPPPDHAPPVPPKPLPPCLLPAPVLFQQPAAPPRVLETV